MKLLFDLGNSNLAWAISAKPEWRTGRLTSAGPGRLGAVLDQQFASLPAPEGIWISSVGNPARLEELTTWIRGQWPIHPNIVEASAGAFGVTNCYSQAATLGTDRWAAMIAVSHRFETPACIIDAGTAVTLDLLDKNSHFLGGSIFPGLDAARQALVSSTARLSAKSGSEKTTLACSTADAIAAGTRAGWVGAIRRILDSQISEANLAPRVYITGGDGVLLAQEIGCEHELVPDLVLQGLDVMSESST